jgi:phage shock protein A
MFRTITTLFRAQVAEAEEALFDANATRLLEQRIREANAAFEAGKCDLASVLAEEAVERRLAEEAGSRMSVEEAAAVVALGVGDEAEAERLAERIAGLTDDLKAHEFAAQDCAEAARRIRKSLEANARLLGELRRGLATAKAAAAVNRANQRSLGAAGVSDSAIQEARRTLERIRVRQGEQRDFMDAMERVERDPSLKAPGAAAPQRWPETDPRAVLERLKARGASTGAEPR